MPHKTSVERILDRHALSSQWKLAAEEDADRAARDRQHLKTEKIMLAKAQRDALDAQIKTKELSTGTQLTESKSYLAEVLRREARDAEIDRKRRLAAREKERLEALAFEREHAAERLALAAAAKIADKLLLKSFAPTSTEKMGHVNRSATTEPVINPSPGSVNGRRCHSSAEVVTAPPHVGILPNILERHTKHTFGSVSPPPEVLARIERQLAVMSKLPSFVTKRVTELSADGFPLPYEDEAAIAAKRARTKELRDRTRAMLEAQINLKEEAERQRREQDRMDASAVQADGFKLADALERKHLLAVVEVKNSLRQVLDEQIRYSRVVRKAHDVTHKI